MSSDGMRRAAAMTMGQDRADFVFKIFRRSRLSELKVRFYCGDQTKITQTEAKGFV
jgi:hypothetical protein